jgi:hypothetical protein
MKAGWRLGTIIWAAALAAAPAPAQEANQAESAAPAPSSAIGPQELKNFELQGNVTRPADQPPAAAQRTTPARPRAQSPTTQNAVQSVAGNATEARSASAQREAVDGAEGERSPQHTARAPAPEPLRQTPPASSVTVSLPRLDNGAIRGSAAAPVPVATAGLDSPATVPPDHKLSILPWLLAAFALGAGAALLLLRNRSREALAGGPAFDAFVAPEPEIAPPPAPAPAPAPAPEPRAEPLRGTVTAGKRPEPSLPGIVSTRLRPSIDIGFNPTGCLVEDHQITFEFEIELLNSGNAPARGVLVEATVFNASTNQDQELEAFFANPLARGERIPIIQPLKRVRLKSRVVAERQHVQVYEIGGRKVFVPIIGFNALYRWRSTEGQTSASFLLGVDTKSEKMAPFRLDLGTRLFQSVAARELPNGIRK